MRRTRSRNSGSSSTSRMVSPPPGPSAGRGSVHGSGVASMSGRCTSKRAPRPRSERSRMKPPPWRTMPSTVASPRPVPRPNSLVVKNGSNTCIAMSLGTPMPLSSTHSRAYGPGRASAWVRQKLSSDLDHVRGDLQPAAAGHGVARVDREVDEHLLQLRRIGQHRARPVAGLEAERDVLADDAAQHLERALDQRPHVEQHRRDHLLAAERQQLRGEPRRALRRRAHLAQLLVQRIRRRGCGSAPVRWCRG